MNTNLSHEVPNSFSGSSDSKPIGKKPRVDEDSKQVDLKNQQESSETRHSDQENFEYNPKPSQQKKKRKGKNNRYFEESEEEGEYEDQNDFAHQSHNHFDDSNPDSQNLYAESDEKVEEEAENVYQEDEHENVTPDATNEPPNPSYEENFEEYPDSSENPANFTEDEPYVKQSDSGHDSGPHSSKTQDNNRSNDTGNKKGADNTNFNAYDHSRSQGDQRGHQNPPGGQKSWFAAKRAYEN